MAIAPMSPQFDPERGAILIISLLMIIVMTALAVASFDESHIVQKITKNMDNVSRADNANDVAQIAAKAWLDSLTQRPNTCNSSPCGSNLVWQRATAINPAPPLAETMDDAWWSANGRSINGTVTGVLNQPLYVISEGVCDNTASARYYRIVSRSVGVTNPPKKFAVLTVKSTLPPPVSTLFNQSGEGAGAIGEWSGSIFQNSFYPSGAGNISGIWVGFGTGCSESNSALVTISAPGKPTVSYTLNFPSKTMCGAYYGARQNMTYAALPQPYPVLQTDYVSIRIQNFGGTAVDYFNPPGNDYSKPIPYRSTVDGTTEMCQ